MCSEPEPPRLQNPPPALRPGGLVRVRGATWHVKAVRSGEDCLAVDLVARGSRCRLRTLLHPFERFVPVCTVQRPKHVSRRRWTTGLRELMDDCARWTTPRALDSANVDLLPYQLEPLLAVLKGVASRLLLADAVGTGKTIEAGLILAELGRRGLVRRTLVVTPAGLRHQWIDELARRFGIEATLADVAWLARRTRELPRMVNPWGLPGCFVTSVDFLKQPEVVAAAREHPWDLLVVDEAHLAARGTDRGQAVHSLAARSQWVVLLSATPHDGDDERFAALCQAGRVGAPGDPLLVFRRSHAVRDLGHLAPKTRTMVVRPTPAEAHAHRLLGRYAALVWDASRTDPTDAARLATTVLLKRAFSSMHALERSVLRRIRLLAMAPQVPAQQPLPLDLVAQDGECRDDEEPDAVLGAKGLANQAHERAWLGAIAEAARTAARDERKLAFVRRVLSRTAEPLLLFTEYRDTLAWLARSIAPLARVEVLHGGQTARERADAIAAFSAGRARVLLATDAAALGLNLQQRCRLVVNLEVPWNPTRVAQRVGRLARIGQRRRVHALVLVAGSTGEERVLAAYRSRETIIAQGLGAIHGDGAADDLTVSAAILDRRHPFSAPTVPSANGRVPHDGHSPAALTCVAGSTLAPDARRCISEVVDRRRTLSVRQSAGELARRHPWVTRLRLRGIRALRLGTPGIATLVFIRARLVDASGHAWASTLVPLCLPRTLAPDTASWDSLLAAVGAWIASEDGRHLQAYTEPMRTAVEGFVGCAVDRANAVDACLLAERRRGPHQQGLFESPGGPAPVHDSGDGGTRRAWPSLAKGMTVEYDTVLGAAVRCAWPSSRLCRGTAGRSGPEP